MKVNKLSCPNCGAKLKRGLSSCEYCGSALSVEHETTEAGARETGLVAETAEPITPIQAIDAAISAVQKAAELSAEMEESAKIAAQIEAERASEKKHRVISSIVSAVTGAAGIASGIILLNINVYVGIALLSLGILCMCKIFYTFMRASYNMTRAGYIYSGIICALITGFGIYGGIQLLVISADVGTQLMCVIPFLLAAVSLSYFVTKTVFWVKNKRS